MAALKEDWVTDGLIDFEYKKYLLLSYCQQVNEKFDQRELYPILDDLIFHYNNLQTLRKNKQILYKQFPKALSKADFQQLKLTYKRIVKDDEMMKEIEDIILFAIPHFKDMLNMGKELYEEVAQHLKIETVGIIPMKLYEGYVFINEFQKKDTQVYSYQVTIFESPQERYRGISTTYMETIRRSPVQTYESIKRDIIRQYKDLPNPATFLVDVLTPCPFEETLLPVAKRALVRRIAELVPEG